MNLQFRYLKGGNGTEKTDIIKNKILNYKELIQSFPNFQWKELMHDRLGGSKLVFCNDKGT